MRILVVSDERRRRTSGAVTTLFNIQRELKGMGHQLRVMHAGRPQQMPALGYPEIPIAWPYRGAVQRKVEQFRPDAIHIMNEGSLCRAVRNWCVREGVPFTTSYATRIPEYVQARAPIPLWVTWAYLRWFHRPAVCTMVSLPSMASELRRRRFGKTAIWSRGVDADLFAPREAPRLPGSYPAFMYVGRVAVEKNIEAFLRLELPGTKWVIGDGPDLGSLKRRFKKARFTGCLKGKTLAETLAAASVVVFPSRTDAFGLVVLEANACDVPVACYPGTGPGELVRNGVNGFALAEEQGGLFRAATRSLGIRKGSCRAEVMRYSWRRSAEQFLENLAPIPAA